MEILILDPGNYEGTYEAETGLLCLDFANTVSARNSEHPHEWLSSYSNLIAWGRLTGALTPEESKSLRMWANEDPEAREAVMERAIALREALHRLFIEKGNDYPDREADLETLNREVQIANEHQRLVANSGGFHWEWPHDSGELDAMLWPAAKSAVDLLLSEDLQRVGACAAEDCGWFFMDHSKNHSRRWCDMNDCGNRAKARKHYQRKKMAQAESIDA